MNREQRRLMEREERRNKANQEGSSRREQAAARAGVAPAGEKVSLWKRLTTFLHEVRIEMKKVSWPTQQQMIAFTSVTVITSAALTVIIFGLDVAMKQVVLFFIGGL